jgi:hypothetical protein
VLSDGSGATATNGDPVGRILDLSGNNNHAIAAGDANRATLTATGWSFDGSNDYYNLTQGVPLADALTVVRGFKRSTTAGVQHGLCVNNNYFPREAIIYLDTIYVALSSTSAQLGPASTGSVTGNCVLTSIRDGQTQTARFNQSQVLTGAAGALSTPAPTMSVLGKEGNSNTTTNEELYFLAVFPGILSADDLDFVESIAQRIP